MKQYSYHVAYAYTPNNSSSIALRDCTAVRHNPITTKEDLDTVKKDITESLGNTLGVVILSWQLIGEEDV